MLMNEVSDKTNMLYYESNHPSPRIESGFHLLDLPAWEKVNVRSNCTGFLLFVAYRETILIQSCPKENVSGMLEEWSMQL